MLLAKENNGIIVCQNPSALQQKAYGYGIVGIDYMSYADFIELMISTQIHRPIYIDELDDFLYCLNDNIKGYSLSED
jgi:hypothetical protein